MCKNSNTRSMLTLPDKIDKSAPNANEFNVKFSLEPLNRKSLSNSFGNAVPKT